MISPMRLALTICSANYLAYAKSLADSLVMHNPDHRFVIVLLDETEGLDLSTMLPHEVVAIADLGVPRFAEMNARYDIFELSCALKPFVIEYFLKARPELQTVYYFDSDILVFNSLQASDEALQHHPILLTPHILSPIPLDGLFSNEEVLLRAGIYNAGFFGVSQSEETFRFLNWWKERMEVRCFNDVANGLFVDQLWLNLVPVYFRGTHVLQHAGYNLAYWNLHERNVSSSADGYMINDSEPLVFVHYSGYDLSAKDVISKHQDRYSFNNKPALLPLFQTYAEAIEKNGHEQFMHIVPAYGTPKAPPPPPEKKQPFYKRLF
jgi:hypothetical protein